MNRHQIKVCKRGKTNKWANNREKKSSFYIFPLHSLPLKLNQNHRKHQYQNIVSQLIFTADQLVWINEKIHEGFLQVFHANTVNFTQNKGTTSYLKQELSASAKGCLRGERIQHTPVFTVSPYHHPRSSPHFFCNDRSKPPKPPKLPCSRLFLLLLCEMKLEKRKGERDEW